MALEEDLAHYVGVVEDISPPFNTRFMFPSKVGGKPAWLVPRSLPGVRCDNCDNPMTFLLQVYAPDQERADAFHRSLMVFTCLRCRCFLKCLRSQLPLANDFYDAEAASFTDIPSRDPVLDEFCCETCGMISHSDTTACRSLPEYSLEIEEVEKVEGDLDDEEDGSYDENGDNYEVDAGKLLQQSSEMSFDESEVDLFNEFTETQLERDASFRRFKRFTQSAPSNHAIYYSCGGSPIWITDKHQMSDNIPHCDNCGSRRHFEFQIQPQLIYHLMRRLRGFPMDAAPFEWGVVAIYTCTENCINMSHPYLEEFVFNQLEPSEWLEFGRRKKVDFRNGREPTRAPIVENMNNDADEWI
jgi:pre-rRNA-processing protein TSR4